MMICAVRAPTVSGIDEKKKDLERNSKMYICKGVSQCRLFILLQFQFQVEFTDTRVICDLNSVNSVAARIELSFYFVTIREIQSARPRGVLFL